MVQALGEVFENSKKDKWLAIFAFRIGSLLQSDEQRCTRPPFTWEEQEIRNFIGRVFGLDKVVKVAALPAIGFNNYSEKDIQEHLFKFAMLVAGDALGYAISLHLGPQGPAMYAIAKAGAQGAISFSRESLASH